MKCCLYARIYNETPYLNFFLEYYFNLGFSKFILLKADNETYYISNKIKKDVTIINIQNLPNEQELEDNSKYIFDSNCDWVFGCDIDEFLIIDKKFTNIQDFISEKLLINNNINTFYFRWIQIYKLDNNNYNSLKDLLQNYLLFKNENIKSLVKISSMISMSHPHHFILNEKETIYFENKILHHRQLIHIYNQLSYKESFILHLNVRNINNLFIKYIDSGKNWNIPDYYKFNHKTFDKFLLNNSNIFLTLENIIINTGNRCAEIQKTENIINLNLNNYLFFNNNYNLFNSEREKELLYKINKFYKNNLTNFYLLLYNVLEITDKNKNFFKI